MTTEKQFFLDQAYHGRFYNVRDHDDDFTNIFSHEELCFLGVPQEVFKAVRKGPVKFKLTFEALCE